MVKLAVGITCKVIDFPNWASTICLLRVLWYQNMKESVIVDGQ